MMDELKNLLPAWYDGIYEMQVLMDIEMDLLQELLNHIKSLQSNQYISTADSKTIEMYEQMLRITVEPSDSLELRRFRVLTRIASQKPYTLNYLQELLSSFGGPAELTMLYNEYRLIANINFERPGQLSEVDYLFRAIVPANILTEINNRLNFVSPPTTQYIGAGMVVTEMVTITQDLVEAPRLDVVAKVANANVVTTAESWSGDTKQEPIINVTSINASGVVFFESIEIH